MSTLAVLSSKDLAFYILTKLEKASQIKLHKLIYYIDAWHLVFLDSSIVDEDFEAWVHGPVVRSLWDYFKSINKQAFYADMSLKKEKKEIIIKRIENILTQEQIEVITDVLESYGDNTGYHLETLTHSELPWQEARIGLSPSDRGEKHISKDTMRKFYRDTIDVTI